MHNRISVFFIILNISLLLAQRPQQSLGIIRGQVVDEATSNPLEYVNMMVYSESDSTYVSGGTTDQQGRFLLTEIRSGRYYLQVKYIGYHILSVDSIRIGRRRMRIDLKQLALKRTVLESESIEVVGERPLVEYRIDKKIVNVTEEYSSLSGTAVDVLESVPSINVDIEGNVRLRGSSSFSVLIDGRPTALDASDALQQIPASTIENIEIITNPSARYDPEGIAGIVNVITKKRRLEGISGMVNSNAGLDDKYGGNVLVSYRSDFGSVALSANYDLRSYPGKTETENRTYYSDTTSTIYSQGSSLFQRRRMGINGEVELFLSPRDNLVFSFRLGDFTMERGSNLDYLATVDVGNLSTEYTSSSSTERGGSMAVISGDYRHQFSSESEFTARLSAFGRGGNERSTNQLMNPDNLITSGQITTEDGPSFRGQLELNYSRPIAGAARLEAGYDGRMGKSEDITSLSAYDSESGEYIDTPAFSHNIAYERNIHAFYSMLAREAGRLGFQIGVRGEFTDRQIELSDSNESFEINRWDIFPALHSSYQFKGKLQLMASYSRRINRPRGWYLEPFITWSDAYNVRSGNPDLEPEYINSYELGIQIPFRKNIISIETYHRQTKNVIERVRSVYAPNVMLRVPENVGTSYSQGIELLCNWREISWWDISLTGNLYFFSLAADLYGNEFDQSSTNWNLRLNNTFRIGDNTRLQVTSRYSSATVTAQGEREGSFTTNLGLRQNLLGRQLSAILQINDVFSSSVRESISEGTGFYTYNLSSRNTPIIMLTLSYNFNNFRERNDQRQRGGEDFNDDF